MALLSYSAILVPIVFFILDVANPDLAGWGDYIRWVGAAAASVVVWEWVERIEALERDERKDGILGREVFDGDELLDDGNSDDGDWPVRVYRRDRSLTPRGNGPRSNESASESRMRTLRFRLPQTTRRHGADSFHASGGIGGLSTSATTATPNVPSMIASPVNRSDTTSAASTVYAVHLHPNAPSLIPQGPILRPAPPSDAVPGTESSTLTTDLVDENEKAEELLQGDQPSIPAAGTSLPFWRAAQNPFKRKRMLPPAEVADAQRALGNARVSPVEKTVTLRSKAKALASVRRCLGSGARASQPAEQLPVTVIPAQRRGTRMWSPDDTKSSQALETNNGAAQLSVAEPWQGRSPETWTGSARRPLPVTIIPAPRRGQRTWSPDDLNTSSPAIREATITTTLPNAKQGDSRSAEPTQDRSFVTAEATTGLIAQDPSSDGTINQELRSARFESSANHPPSSHNAQAAAPPQSLVNPCISTETGSIDARSRDLADADIDGSANDPRSTGSTER